MLFAEAEKDSGAHMLRTRVLTTGTGPTAAGLRLCGWIGVGHPHAAPVAPAAVGGLRFLHDTGRRAPKPLRTPLPLTMLGGRASSSSSSVLPSVEHELERRGGSPFGGWGGFRRRPFGTSVRSTAGDAAEAGTGGKEEGSKAPAGSAAAGASGQHQHHHEEEENVGGMAKMKLMMKRYGPVAVVTYLGVYVTTLGLLFGAIESGVNPFDYGLGDSGSLVDKVTGMLEGYSWGEPIVESIRKNPHVGNFAIAWILTKFTEPIRAVVTIGIVPRIARALGRAPPLPNKP